MTSARLPCHWRDAALRDAARFTRKPRNLRYAELAEVPFVPMELVPIGHLCFRDFELRRGKEVTSGTYFEPGDILLAKITPSFENGKQGIIQQLPTPFGIATTEVIALSGIPEVSDTLYLFYYLLRGEVRSELAGKMEGTTGRQRLSQKAVEDLRVPLPPLPEQRAIARVLRAVQTAREARQREVALERERRAALMEHLFTHGTRGEPTKQTPIGEMPESWEAVKFSDVVEVTEGQVNPLNVPYRSMMHVGPENIESGTGRLVNLKTNAELNIISGNYLFTPDDILYSKIRPYLNKAALPDFEGTCSADMYPLRPHIGQLDRRFLFHFLLSQQFVSQAISFQERTGIPKINRVQLGSLLLAKPSPAEQNGIADALTACDAKIAALERESALLDELFRALLEELMTGRVSVDRLVGRREAVGHEGKGGS